MTPELRGFLKLLGVVAVGLAFLALLFWPQVVVWLSEFFGV